MLPPERDEPLAAQPAAGLRLACLVGASCAVLGLLGLDAGNAPAAATWARAGYLAVFALLILLLWIAAGDLARAVALSVLAMMVSHDYRLAPAAAQPLQLAELAWDFVLSLVLIAALLVFFHSRFAAYSRAKQPDFHPIAKAQP